MKPWSWKSVPAQSPPLPPPPPSPAMKNDSLTEQQLQQQQKQKQQEQQQHQNKANKATDTTIDHSKFKRQHLSKRTSNAAHINDGDGSIDDSYHDFGNYNEYSDHHGDHMDIMDEGINQPMPAPKGLPSNFISRGMRGQRQYDVPQIGKFC